MKKWRKCKTPPKLTIELCNNKVGVSNKVDNKKSQLWKELTVNTTPGQQFSDVWMDRFRVTANTYQVLVNDKSVKNACTVEARYVYLIKWPYCITQEETILHL